MAEPPGEENEPRFAGSAPAGYVAPGPPVSPWASESRAPIGYPPPAALGMPTSPPPDTGPFPLQPEVSYSGPLAVDDSPSRLDTRGGWALLIAAAGGVIAVVSSQLTGATLELNTGAESPAEASSNIEYDGFTLIEGRVMLGLGVLAVVFSALVILRRPLLVGIWVTGLVGLGVTAFAAISHPVDLATLLHSNAQVDDVAVSAPNGTGVWLALAGGALILIGGLAAQFVRSGRPQLYRTNDAATGIEQVPGV